MGSDGTNLKEIRMDIGGMTCTGCEEHVSRALGGAGAQDVEVDFRRGEARFRVTDGADIALLADAVRATGYKPGEWEVVSGISRGDSETEEMQGATADRAPGAHGDSDGRHTHGDGGDDRYDLAIIGSGSAAFAAAIQAVNRGARVAMIEKGTIGGTCVNIGCVPSKTLLRAGEIQFEARSNPFRGLTTTAGPVDLGLLVGQKNELVAELRREKYIDLIDEYGFDLIRGEARFLDAHTVEIRREDPEEAQTLAARNFLIATGARPAVPDIEGLAGVPYLTSTTALELKQLPESLIVIGAGYIGLELGQLFRHLGARVTIMQRSGRLLKRYDPEISEAVGRILMQKGMDVLSGVTYLRIEGDEHSVRVHYEQDGRLQVVEGEKLLVAAGRRPNTDALDLARAGVEVGSRGEVRVDDHLRTNVPHIYAAGDVTLGPQFVYVAAYQGTLAADNALGASDRKQDLRAVPGVTFTQPAIATVGLTEAAAREEGYEVNTSVLPLEAVPRALVNHETTGVFKMVADAQSGKILGVHIVAEDAGDVIYAGVLAVKFGLTVQDLKETLAPYLTMAEGMKLAALTFDTDVSKLSCCAG